MTATIGIWEAGRLPWSRLILPTVALVEKGVHDNNDLAYRLKAKSAEIKAKPSMRYKVTAMHQRISLYIPQYFPPGTSSTKKRAKLRRSEIFYGPTFAKTLRDIAQYGVEAFYNGTIGDQLVEDIGKRNGILTKQDLQQYRQIKIAT